VLKRLRRLALFIPDGKEYTAVNLVRAGLVDPFKLIAKNEPHTIEKLEDGRVRLVCSVSVVDNIIEMLLDKPQNLAEINMWKLLPLKPGMGLHDEGLEALFNYVKQIAAICRLAEADISGWDWTMQWWEMVAEHQGRLELNGGAGTIWDILRFAHVYCMARKVFVLADGEMIEQLTPGVMASGRYNTSRGNSYIRALDHLLVVDLSDDPDKVSMEINSTVMVQGDDSVEQFVIDGQQIYRDALGKSCKMYNLVTSDNFNFCSTQFCGSYEGYPTNVMKCMVNFLQQTPANRADAGMLLFQLEDQLRHSPDKARCMSLVVSSGWMDEWLSPSAASDCVPQSVNNKTLNCHWVEQPKEPNPVSGANKMPRDCTDSPVFKFTLLYLTLIAFVHFLIYTGNCSMYSPVSSLQYPIQMTNNKTKTKRVVVASSRKKTNKRKNTMQVVRFQPNQGNLKQSLVLRAKPSPNMSGGKNTAPSRAPISNLPQFVIAQVDPFSPRALGVKVPDEANMPSAVAFSRDIATLNVQATFAGAGYVFRFDPANYIISPVPTSSTSWTWPTFAAGNSPVQNQAALNTNFDLLRTVAFGIKIITRQSAFAAAGFLHVALVGESLTGTSYSYPTSVSAMEYAPSYRRIPIADLIEDEVLVPGKFTDASAFRYLSPNVQDVGAAGGYSTNYQSSGWSAIMIWVESPTLSLNNIIDVEIIHHYEALTKSGLAGGVIECTMAAPTSPAVMAATTYVTERMPNIQVDREDEEDTGKYWALAGKLFKTGLKVASGVFPVLAPIDALFSAMSV